MSNVVPKKAVSSFLSAADIDLSTNAGVLSLLSFIRNIPMVRNDYNELRDLIFAYKHTVDNAAAKEKIFHLLHSAGVIETLPSDQLISDKTQTLVEDKGDVIEQATDTKKDSRPVLGAVRLKPSFANTQSVVVPKEEVDISADLTESPPKIKNDDKDIAPQPKEEENTNTATEMEVKAKEPENIATVKEVAATPNTPSEQFNADESSREHSDPLKRIQEIKKDVNSKIGNPINLISLDKDLGRAYMNSLLAAMKKLNGGTAAEVTQAMADLEKSYSAVLELAADKPSNKKEEGEGVIVKSTIVNQTKVSLDEKAQTSPEPTAVPNSATIKLTVNDQSKIQDSPGDEKSDQANEEDIKSTESEENQTEINRWSSAAEVGKTIDEEVTQSLVEPEPVQKPVTADTGLDKKPKVSATLPSYNETSESRKPLQSVAKERQAENSISTLKREEIIAANAKEEAAIAALDPLERPDVTDGLKQLLLEWPLFKSSGMFGTGPRGIEHPLYKKLSTLQMTALVAGRFEDSTPEIHQSITDYMNGWRYEEGILHQQSETFEHYLRRVIRHILDKQKKQS